MSWKKYKVYRAAERGKTTARTLPASSRSLEKAMESEHNIESVNISYAQTRELKLQQTLQSPASQDLPSPGAGSPCSVLHSCVCIQGSWFVRWSVSILAADCCPALTTSATAGPYLEGSWSRHLQCCQGAI